MSGQSITTFLKLNQNLTSGHSAAREFQLPRMNPFPKLDQRIAGPTGGARRAAAGARSGAATILGDIGPLPEMTTDVIDPAAGYAVENVKRERSAARSWPRLGWGMLVGRMLGGQRAARL